MTHEKDPRLAALLSSVDQTKALTVLGEAYEDDAQNKQQHIQRLEQVLEPEAVAELFNLLFPLWLGGGSLSDVETKLLQTMIAATENPSENYASQTALSLLELRRTFDQSVNSWAYTRPLPAAATTFPATFPEIISSDLESAIIGLMPRLIKHELKNFFAPGQTDFSAATFMATLATKSEEYCQRLGYSLLFKTLEEVAGYQPDSQATHFYNVDQIPTYSSVPDSAGAPRWIRKGTHDNQGGEASFFKAYDLKLKRLVGIKVTTGEESVLDKAVRESEVTAGLGASYEEASDFVRQHLPFVYDVVRTSDSVMMVQELLTPDNNFHLSQFDYTRNPSWVPAHDQAFVLHLIKELCTLAHIFTFLKHAHHDIGPNNLFLKKRPGQFPSVVVIDFGLSQSVAPLDDMMGTLHITAPERHSPHFRAAVAKDYRVALKSEAFSITTVLLELLGFNLVLDPIAFREELVIGDIDFEATMQPFNFTSEQISSLKNLVLKGLAETNERFSNPLELFRALKQALATT